MIDRERIMFPIQGADASVGRAEPWLPPATPYDSFQEYTLLRSTPEEWSNRAVQFTIRGRGVEGGLMRVENSREGYFSAVWWSSASLGEFLEAAEAYFRDLDHLFTTETSGQFGVFTGFKEPEFYEFGRPLTLAGLQTGGVFLGDETHSLELFRMDTPAGDLTLEPEDQRQGLIRTFDPATDEAVIQATGKLVSQTQRLLTPDVVAKVLNDLPYRKAA